ncbi:hypothetical protein EYW49_05700 [Siculibacillus lacustris]|uniref:Acyltransferase 3 domain-containing protein n=1 Tax=Siculibacillus lacustris TaxID=1549641 RepID=A0A4Q9VUA6_9HYPH|nr:acyltransferase [Siculibacillus lacustris]TBW39752.1 hypothetical protein EYW49_05700 [Siculibacillus lacustris]
MPTDRFRALDELRAFVVFLVVALHAALTYMVYAPEWWYVLDPQRSLIYTRFVLLVDVPIMLIMFFLAGYFALPSLERKGAATFLKDKAIRIGGPWVFGVLVLAPPTAWMIYYSRGAPLSLFAFWTGDFWGVAYQQSVYWFLGVLLALFLATALVWRLTAGTAIWRRRPAAPPAWVLAAFVLAMILASLATGSSVDRWSHNWVLVYQPARVPLYVGYFALGIWADRSGWFTDGGWHPKLVHWLPAMIVAGLVYDATRMILPTLAPAGLVNLATAVFFNVFCFTSLLAGIAVFSLRRSHGPVSQSLARTAYGIYYLHPLILYPLALIAVAWPVSIHVKMPAITLIAWLVSWALSAGVLTRVPGLRRMF